MSERKDSMNERKEGRKEGRKERPNKVQITRESTE